MSVFECFNLSLSGLVVLLLHVYPVVELERQTCQFDVHVTFMHGGVYYSSKSRVLLLVGPSALAAVHTHTVCLIYLRQALSKIWPLPSLNTPMTHFQHVRQCS